MFQLHEDDIVSVSVKGTELPLVEHAVVEEIFPGKCRVGGRDFDFVGFEADGRIFVLDPDLFVIKHQS